ncbi:hypothetical protein L7F22_001082 [Adiantum nelumboides]|nr:hypothetical protein [Adiantum nelumboides]
MSDGTSLCIRNLRTTNLKDTHQKTHSVDMSTRHCIYVPSMPLQENADNQPSASHFVGDGSPQLSGKIVPGMHAEKHFSASYGGDAIEEGKIENGSVPCSGQYRKMFVHVEIQIAKPLHALGLFVLLVVFSIFWEPASDYFSCTLEQLLDVLNLSPVGAKANLLAIGDGAPDVFASVVALASSDCTRSIRCGSVLGGAFFITIFVFGTVALVTCKDSKETKFDIFRRFLMRNALSMLEMTASWTYLFKKALLRVQGILEQHTREEVDHQSRPTSIARAGTQEHSQVSQKDVEDVEENGGAEELVDSIVHDLKQENLEKAVDQVTEGQYDDEVTEGQYDDEEVTEGQHDDEVTEGQYDDELTEGQHDDEVTEGQHDEKEGQHDDEVTEGQQDDEVTEGQNISNLGGGRRNKLEVFGSHYAGYCLVKPLGKMNDYAYVPTTFGDKLFQLRRLGEADKTTLLDGLAIEDRAWVEKEMQVVSTWGKRSWFTLPVQIMTWLLFKDEMEQKIEELAKGMDETDGTQGDCKRMLDEMPPLASVWTYVDNPTFMYSDVKLGRSLSTIEKAKCPWWLDMVKNHVPDKELELFQQHKATLQLTTTTNSVLEEETMATSQVIASTASASFRKTLPINLGREVVHRALQANKAIEDGKMQGQHQSASSSGGLRENDDIINETLEPTRSVDAFALSI